MDPRLAGRQPRPVSDASNEKLFQSTYITFLSALLKPEPKATRVTQNAVKELHTLLVSVATNSLSSNSEVN